MINWDNIEGPTGWASIAEELLTAARNATRVHNIEAMQGVSADLLAFVQNRTSECPQAVADAVFHGQSELTLAIATTSVDQIQAATAQLNAYLVDVQRASTALDQQAKLIALGPVINTLHAVHDVIENAQGIRQKIANQKPQNLDIPALEGDIQAMINQLNRIASDLQALSG
jgi:hypothetical protein